VDSQLVTWLLNAGVAGVWVVCIMLGLLYPRRAVTDLKEELRVKDAQIAAKDIALDAQRERADTLERLIVSTMMQSGVKVPDALLPGAAQPLPASLPPVPGGHGGAAGV